MTPDGTLDPWFARVPAGSEGGGEEILYAVVSGDFPAGSVVDLPGSARPSGWRVAVRSVGRRVTGVQVHAPGAPPMWFVDLPEPAADPAARTVIAFSDTRFTDGALLDAEQARVHGIGGDHQVASLRWYTGSGLVHQIYVRPAFRRRGVGSKVVQAAFGLQAAAGGPPLYGDGRRTDLGEDWRRRLPEEIAVRMAPRTHRLAPMTPGEPVPAGRS